MLCCVVSVGGGVWEVVEGLGFEREVVWTNTACVFLSFFFLSFVLAWRYVGCSGSFGQLFLAGRTFDFTLGVNKPNFIKVLLD